MTESSSNIHGLPFCNELNSNLGTIELSQGTIELNISSNQLYLDTIELHISSNNYGDAIFIPRYKWIEDCLMQLYLVEFISEDRFNSMLLVNLQYVSKHTEPERCKEMMSQTMFGVHGIR